VCDVVFLQKLESFIRTISKHAVGAFVWPPLHVVTGACEGSPFVWLLCVCCCVLCGVVCLVVLLVVGLCGSCTIHSTPCVFDNVLLLHCMSCSALGFIDCLWLITRHCTWIDLSQHAPRWHYSFVLASRTCSRRHDRDWSLCSDLGLVVATTRGFWMCCFWRPCLNPNWMYVGHGCVATMPLFLGTMHIPSPALTHCYLTEKQNKIQLLIFTLVSTKCQTEKTKIKTST